VKQETHRPPLLQHQLSKSKEKAKKERNEQLTEGNTDRRGMNERRDLEARIDDQERLKNPDRHFQHQVSCAFPSSGILITCSYSRRACVNCSHTPAGENKKQWPAGSSL